MKLNEPEKHKSWQQCKQPKLYLLELLYNTTWVAKGTFTSSSAVQTAKTGLSCATSSVYNVFLKDS